MLAVSDQFLAALRYGHAIKTVATAYPPSGAPVDLPVEDGTVTIDRTAAHRRQLQLTVAPKYPSGHALEGQEVYPSTTANPIAPYGTEIVVSTGIRFANEAVELAQQGIFRVEDVSRDLPGGAVTINAWDRSRQILDARFFTPRKFTAQHATTLIQLLISEVYPAASFNITTGDSTTIPKHVVDRDRWAEVQRVAQVIGCEVFPDPTGVWVIQDVPDLATAPSVWQVDAGEAGVLISATDSVSREGVPNTVIALGESVSGNNAPVHSQTPHGRDLDPLSPTYLFGAYGGVARFYSSPHIRTQAQADRVADAQLADHLGATRLVSFNAVANPALDAGDCITIIRPDGSTERHIIDALTIPLSPSGEMTAETRAQDWSAD